MPGGYANAKKSPKNKNMLKRKKLKILSEIEVLSPNI